MIINKHLKNELNLHLNLTRFCPVGCDHCYIDKSLRANKEFLTLEKINEIFYKLEIYLLKYKNINNLNLTLIGGELLYLDINYLNSVMDCIDNLKKQLNIHISTGFATSLIKPKINDYMSLFKRIDFIYVSYDYEVRFNKNTFDMFVENINILDKENIKMVLNVTVTKFILNKINEVFDIIRTFPIKEINLSYFIPEKKNDELLPKFDETSDFIINFYKIGIKEGYKIYPIESMKDSIKNKTPNLSTVCEIFNTFNINFNGDVHSCQLKGGLDNQTNIPNILKPQSFNDINETVYFKKEFLRALKIDKMCQKCEYKDMCLGGCSILKEYQYLNEKECFGFKKIWDFTKNLKK